MHGGVYNERRWKTNRFHRGDRKNLISGVINGGERKLEKGTKIVAMTYAQHNAQVVVP